MEQIDELEEIETPIRSNFQKDKLSSTCSKDFRNEEDSEERRTVMEKKAKAIVKSNRKVLFSDRFQNKIYYLHTRK